jgi:ribosomal protein L12E/L44/L45/RPP1/RPP2
MAISLIDRNAVFAALRALSMTQILQVQNAAEKAAATAAAGKAQSAAEAAARSRADGHNLDIKT